MSLGKVQNPLHLPHETALQRPKVVRTCGVFSIFTSKCASRHDGMHFFHISTSKSSPNVVRFEHFHFECFAPQLRTLCHLKIQKLSKLGVLSQIGFEMCFMPQQRAFCWHLNFQKVFWPFRLQNLLCATTACNFSPLRPEAWPGPFRAPSSSISTDSFSSDFFLFCDCFHHCCCICP